MHAHDEKGPYVFHMRQFILNIAWQGRITNNFALQRGNNIPSILTLLKQKHMWWLGHLVNMDDGRMPKDLLYGELAQGTRPTGGHHLMYKDVCKRFLVALDINPGRPIAKHRAQWSCPNI